MWMVELVKVPDRNDFRRDYSPRTFRYKANARRLVCRRQLNRRANAARHAP